VVSTSAGQAFPVLEMCPLRGWTLPTSAAFGATLAPSFSPERRDPLDSEKVGLVDIHALHHLVIFIHRVTSRRSVHSIRTLRSGACPSNGSHHSAHPKQAESGKLFQVMGLTKSLFVASINRSILKGPKGPKEPLAARGPKGEPSALEGWIREALCCNPKGGRAFLRILSTEGRGGCLCWEHSNPEGLKLR